MCGVGRRIRDEYERYLRITDDYLHDKSSNFPPPHPSLPPSPPPQLPSPPFSPSHSSTFANESCLGPVCALFAATSSRYGCHVLAEHWVTALLPAAVAPQVIPTEQTAGGGEPPGDCSTGDFTSAPSPPLPVWLCQVASSAKTDPFCQYFYRYADGGSSGGAIVTDTLLLPINAAAEIAFG